MVCNATQVAGNSSQSTGLPFYWQFFANGSFALFDGATRSSFLLTPNPSLLGVSPLVSPAGGNGLVAWGTLFSVVLNTSAASAHFAFQPSRTARVPFVAVAAAARPDVIAAAMVNATAALLQERVNYTLVVGNESASLLLGDGGLVLQSATSGVGGGGGAAVLGVWALLGVTVNVSCVAGSFCPAGATASRLCAAGSFQPLSAQSACLLCPAGFASLPLSFFFLRLV